MVLLTTDKLSKIYWSGEVVEFNATILPIIDEIMKHFLLPKLEDKKEHPLTFKSESGDEISVMIFYLEKGSEGMTLYGWVTDYVRNFTGLAVKKVQIKLLGPDEKPHNARIRFEKERNQTVWDIMIRQSDWQL